MFSGSGVSLYILSIATKFGLLEVLRSWDLGYGYRYLDGSLYQNVVALQINSVEKYCKNKILSNF